MAAAESLREIIEEGQAVAGHRPWPRIIVDHATWDEATALVASQQCTLLGLWGEEAEEEAWVHLALIDEVHGLPAILSLACEQNHFPSVGRAHAPAIRLERAITDLCGLVPVGAHDARPWLDHGTWPLSHPLAAPAHQARADLPQEAYAFLPVEGESLHQIPVGPVHAGIIEPGHFRFTASGETIVRLEERLGYTHKGIETLMRGASAERAARIAGRVSGDSTVAYSFAFCRALEAAHGVAVPPRAVWLRALMAELERLANHFGDFGAICNDAAFAMLHAQCGLLREAVLRVADTCFGHRLMMDRIVPGGVAADLNEGAVVAIEDLIVRVRDQFPELVELYDNTASLQDRTVATGILTAQLARQFGAGGYIGRASGRNFDSRRVPGYAPYDEIDFKVPVLAEGDVDARIWLRIHEIEQSLAIIDQILQQLPTGALIAPLPSNGAGEGIALVEGFRGDILVWVKTRPDGSISRCHLRDPSWFQWPLLEVVIEGNIVADFPLCNKSFNCSYSGQDL